MFKNIEFTDWCAIGHVFCQSNFYQYVESRAIMHSKHSPIVDNCRLVLTLQVIGYAMVYDIMTYDIYHHRNV